MLTLLVSTAVAAVVAVMLRRSDADHLVSQDQAAVGCAAWGALMVVVLAIQVRDWIAAARRFDDWESLDLNDDCQGSLSA